MKTRRPLVGWSQVWCRKFEGGLALKKYDSDELSSCCQVKLEIIILQKRT